MALPTIYLHKNEVEKRQNGLAEETIIYAQDDGEVYVTNEKFDLVKKYYL